MNSVSYGFMALHTDPARIEFRYQRTWTVNRADETLRKSLRFFSCREGNLEKQSIKVNLDQLTIIALHFEASSDNVVRVGVHSEGKRRPVAPGPIVVVGSENLDDFLGLRIFRQNWTIVLQESRWIVIDVLHDDCQCSCRGFRWYPVVDRQDFNLRQRAIALCLLFYTSMASVLFQNLRSNQEHTTSIIIK